MSRSLGLAGILYFVSDFKDDNVVVMQSENSLNDSAPKLLGELEGPRTLGNG